MNFVVKAGYYSYACAAGKKRNGVASKLMTTVYPDLFYFDIAHACLPVRRVPH